MTTAVGIIPARWASSRFPGKPLASIAGQPMIQRVWEGARESRLLQDVLVATDDERIAEACAKFGASAVATAHSHPTGTDRIAEVAAGLDADLVVNIQGDEPLIRGHVVDTTLQALLDTPDASIATPIHRAEAGAAADPHRVKVVVDQHGYALYFSRGAIPHAAAEDGPDEVPRWQHVGLYAYRREFLLEFVRMPRTPAETAERLEQLRALEHGRRIRTVPVAGWRGISVDVPDDIARVEAELARRSEDTGRGGTR